MTDARILAIDAGSQSLRAVLFDPSGAMTASAAVAAPGIARPEAGFAQSDPEDFWRAMCAACAQLADEAANQWQHVAGITLSAQRGTLLFLDKDNHATRPAILWSDERRTKRLTPLPMWLRLGTRLLGAHRKLHDLRTQAPANWVALHEPESWARTSKVVLLSAYLNFRLSGEWLDSAASQVGFLPLNFRQQRWYPPGHWRWRALGHLRPDQMVELRPPGSVLGKLAGQVAAQLALPRETPILAAAADKACEVLGCGARKRGHVALSFGTAVTVNLPHDHFRHVERFIPAFPAATTGGFLSEAQLDRGLRLVPWFTNICAAALEENQRDDDQCAEDILERFLMRTAPGADGLTQELLRNGVFSSSSRLAPGADAALVALARRYDPAQFYRALIENLVLELRDKLHRLTRALHAQPEQVFVAGGGSRSAAICQMTADVLGQALHRPVTPEATSLGAAMCAASGLSWYGSIEQAQDAMRGRDTVIRPDMTMHSLYRTLA